MTVNSCRAGLFRPRPPRCCFWVCLAEREYTVGDDGNRCRLCRTGDWKGFVHRVRRP